MGTSRTILIIFLVIYFVALTMIFGIIPYSDIQINNSSESIGIEHGVGFSYNVINNIKDLPWQLNTLLFYIPLIILFVLLLWSFFPTGNAGQ